MPDERRAIARVMGSKLSAAIGPTPLILPLDGIEAWDRSGQPANDPAGFQAFLDENHAQLQHPAGPLELDAHSYDLAST